MALAYSARPRGLPSRCANRGEGGVEAAGQREKLGEGGVYVGRRRPVMRQARRSLVVPGPVAPGFQPLGFPDHTELARGIFRWRDALLCTHSCPAVDDEHAVIYGCHPGPQCLIGLNPTLCAWPRCRRRRWRRWQRRSPAVAGTTRTSSSSWARHRAPRGHRQCPRHGWRGHCSERGA